MCIRRTYHTIYTYRVAKERVPNNKIKLGVFTRRGNYYEWA